MTISVYKPNFSEEFKNNVSISRQKGASVSLAIVKTGKIIFVNCEGFGRLFGSFTVHLEGDTAEIIASHIIEKDFYPKEAMLVKLVSSLKRRKIKKLKI
jgi:hypothetical protein